MRYFALLSLLLSILLIGCAKKPKGEPINIYLKPLPPIEVKM